MQAASPRQCSGRAGRSCPSRRPPDGAQPLLAPKGQSHTSPGQSGAAEPRSAALGKESPHPTSPERALRHHHWSGCQIKVAPVSRAAVCVTQGRRFSDVPDIRFRRRSRRVVPFQGDGRGACLPRAAPDVRVAHIWLCPGLTYCGPFGAKDPGDTAAWKANAISLGASVRKWRHLPHRQIALGANWRAARFRECERARPEGFEPSTCGLEVRCSIQLSYGREWTGHCYHSPRREGRGVHAYGAGRPCTLKNSSRPDSRTACSLPFGPASRATFPSQCPLVFNRIAVGVRQGGVAVAEHLVPVPAAVGSRTSRPPMSSLTAPQPRLLARREPVRKRLRNRRSKCTHPARSRSRPGRGAWRAANASSQQLARPCAPMVGNGG